MSGRRKLTRLGLDVAAAVGVLIGKDYYRNSRGSSTHETARAGSEAGLTTVSPRPCTQTARSKVRLDV